ncbi:LPS translocon maturation chaperone LptM [Alcaligenes endophyticus]
MPHTSLSYRCIQRLFSIMLCSCLLSACGYKGPLEHPAAQPQPPSAEQPNT